MQAGLRSVTRYTEFDPASVKIHPLKRGALKLASFLPRSWAFRVLGLPFRETAPAPVPDSSPGAEIGRVSDGIASSLGAHLTCQGTYLPKLTLGAGAFIETRFLQRQRCFPRVRKMAGTIASLTFEGQSNYYRWMMETVPRMRFLEEARVPYDRLYLYQKQAFHRDTVRCLGIDPARVIDCSQVPYLQADEVIVPRFIDETEPWIIPWLREKFLPFASPAKDKPRPRRLYISRKKATSRGAVNDAELLALLDQFGFKPVMLEDYDWVSQVALFRDAEAVVAPHGAGLTNLVFCAAPTLVVELIADAYPFSFFGVISRQLRLDHHSVTCQPVEPGQVKASAIRVPVPIIERILRENLTAGS